LVLPSAGQSPGCSSAEAVGRPTGTVYWLLLVGSWQLPWAVGLLGVSGLKPHQFPSSAQHHLAELLEPTLQFTEHLFGVVVGPFLNRGGLMASPSDQGFALLLGLLPELEGIVMEPFRFGLAVALDAIAFLADRFQLGHRLMAAAFMLLEQLAVSIGGFLIEVLTPGLGLLFQLLASGGELLLHLGHAGLQLLLRLGALLPSGEDQLFPLLTGLLAQFTPLSLSLLPHGSGGDQALPFASSLAEDLLSLLAGLLDEAFSLMQQILGLGDLDRQGSAKGVHRFDGVLLIHQAAATEGDAAAFENDVLELVELVENGDGRLAHVIGEGMAD
jgi:hypothetical protein